MFSQQARRARKAAEKKARKVAARLAHKAKERKAMMDTRHNWSALLAYTTVAVSLHRQYAGPTAGLSLETTLCSSSRVASRGLPPGHSGSAASRSSSGAAANGGVASSLKDDLD